MDFEKHTPDTLILRPIWYQFSGWDEVGFLQYLLRLRGYDVPTDRKWEKGDATEKAVIAFQKHVNLNPSGIVDQYTWDKLLERY